MLIEGLCLLRLSVCMLNDNMHPPVFESVICESNLAWEAKVRVCRTPKLMPGEFADAFQSVWVSRSTAGFRNRLNRRLSIDPLVDLLLVACIKSIISSHGS